ncbi:MAG: carbohydrate ABC transporter permease [Thermoleophilia bacterium]|nr:carbohydrate ABC transporter permease [Thermoleophilia bacterium]
MSEAALAGDRPVRPGGSVRRRLRVALRQAVLIAAAVFALYPVYFMVATALKGRNQYLDDKLGLPWPLAWGNFEEAFRGGELVNWFANSAILTSSSVMLSTLVAALAAFAIARMTFRGRNALLAVNVALMVVPPVVMLIPLFVLFTQLDLVGTYHGVLLIYAGLVTPFSVYMLTGFFRAIPRELFESAVIDGASHLRILWRIVLPLSLPAVLTLVLVNSLFVWNELLIALVFLPTDELKTLMVGLTVFRSRYNLDVPVTMAGMVLAVVPMVLLYLFGQRFFIRGLTAGAVKG